MTLLGRPSRGELLARAELAERQRDLAVRATRSRPRRILGFLGRHPLALLASAVVWPVVVVPAVAWGTARGWWAWPRATALTLALGWAAAVHTLPAGTVPTWAGLPLLPIGAWAAWVHERRRPVPAVLVDEQVAVWRTQVADGPDAPAKGSFVADHASPVRDKDGREIGFTLFVTGANSTQHVGYFRSAAFLERLAAIYHRDHAAFTVRAVGDHGRCAIDVLHQHSLEARSAARKARIATVQPWSGPSLEPDGRFRILTVAEDGRPGMGRLWTPGQGVHNIDISGLQGTGKSNAANVVLASIMSAAVVVLDLVDLKGGASLPAWRDVAYRYCTDLDGALLALRRAVAVIKARTAAMAAMPHADDPTRVGVTCIDPTPIWPVYALVVDEFPELARDPRAKADLLYVLEKGRAADVLLVPIHQGTAADEAFGGMVLIRALATNGTVVACRNDQSATGRTVGAKAVMDLAEMGRDTPGEAQLTSPAERVPVHGRVEYLEDVWAAARAARPAVPDAVIEAAVAGAEAPPAPDPAAGVDLVKSGPVSGPAGSMGGVQGSRTTVTYAALTETERRVWDHFRGVGVGHAVSTGAVLTGAGVKSSTFHKITGKFVGAGVLLDLGPGQWAATAALMERSTR